MIEGTTQGAATDADGRYVVIGLRPGTYTVVATFIGYQSTRINDVRVSIDLTTNLNITLREEALQGEEVVVTAERQMIQKDLTATTSVVSGEEIRAIPVENFSDVVNLQAGVVQGHFRGGRSGEVGYWVDGLPVSDVYSGDLGVTVENDMVQEMQVVTGAFNAEYGQAMSGIVNVVTRDGDNKFSGSFSGFAGDYASGDQAIYPNVKSFKASAVRNGELNLSGPVLKNRLFFFASGRYFSNDGYLFGRNVYSFNDVGYNQSNQLTLLNPSGSGDSSLVALNPYERLSGQGKLTYKLSNHIRVAANILASQEDSRNAGYEYLMFPDARLHQKRNSRSTYLKWTHTLSNRTFYEAGFTNNYTSYKQFLFEDPMDERYMDNRIIGEFSDYNRTAGFRAGGTDNSRFNRSTNTYLGKLDLTSQVTRTNLVKLGVEVRRHQLRYNDDYVVVTEDANGQRQQIIATSGRFNYKPFEASAYVQDKIETGGLIINAGVRFDYFDANGQVFKDPTDPNAVYLENRLKNIGDGTGVDYTPDTYFQDSEPTWQLSPRLGVAFPITQGGVIHFSYGHFFQVPNFELLYQNPYFQLGSGGSGLIGLIGNANLKPEHTISGEIGLKQEIGGSSAVELTAYYRDIRDLTGSATDPIELRGTRARYGMLVNSDFGFVRGVVLRYDQRIGDNFFAGVDYTFQIAESNASDPSQVYNAAAAKQELEKQIVPTDWDQRHTVNASVSYSDPVRKWGFGLIASAGSGSPYTPQFTTAQTGVLVPTTIPLNSETRPATYNVDVNLYKDFSFAGTTLQIFSRVNNLFDRRNEYGVFGDTGRATYSLQENVDARTFIGNPDVLTRWYTRPYFYSEPRRVVLGLSVNF